MAQSFNQSLIAFWDSFLKKFLFVLIPLFFIEKGFCFAREYGDRPYSLRAKI